MANWKGMEMVDGRLYKVLTEDSYWIFAYRASVWLTTYYVNVCLDDNEVHLYSRCCDDDEVLDLRIANDEDIETFDDILYERGYRYNLNTKELKRL